MNHWTEDELFRVGTVDAIWRETQAGMDALLARYGMTREGHLYRCDNNQPDTIVLFCHFGIMMVCIGHLLGLSPMLLWHGFCTQRDHAGDGRAREGRSRVPLYAVGRPFAPVRGG